MDVAGAIAQLFAYDAYGQAIGFNPADALTEFLYSGEQFDAKIGQQYLRARYYDPATGTFNRLDPFFGNLNDPQSLHNYLYCHADPVNGIDPSGKFFCTVGILLSTSIIGLMRGMKDTKDIGFLGSFTAFATSTAVKVTLGAGIAADSMALLYRYGSPYIVKEYAQIMIVGMREHFVKNVEESIVKMFSLQAPVFPPGINYNLTDDSYKTIGRLFGEAYTDMVWNFLETHTSAKAANGMRFGWESAEVNPWCDDWTQATLDALNKLGTRKIYLEGGQSVPLGKLVNIVQGQWNHPDNVPENNHLVGQHNFAVMYPMGYTVSMPQNDPVMLIFDAWQSLMPIVYSTSEFFLPIDHVGNIITFPGQ